MFLLQNRPSQQLHVSWVLLLEMAAVALLAEKVEVPDKHGMLWLEYEFRYSFPARSRAVEPLLAFLSCPGVVGVTSVVSVYARHMGLSRDCHIGAECHPPCLAKLLWKKCQRSGEDFDIAITEFLASCREDGFSPNRLFFGRNLRTLLPRLPEKNDFFPAGRLAREEIKNRKSSTFNL